MNLQDERTLWLANSQLDSVRANVSSASTINLTTGAPDTRHINITGTTGITGFTVEAGRVVAFEFYCVFPCGFGRCLRSRLGWKIMTDKFERFGFAQLVNTFNPLDGYGD